MQSVTLNKIDQSGAILHFTDRTRALINVDHHHIAGAWKLGAVLVMVRPKGEMPGTFYLYAGEKEFVDCAWYSGNDQIL